MITEIENTENLTDNILKSSVQASWPDAKLYSYVKTLFTVELKDRILRWRKI